jgi:hypothetical protein
MATELEWFARRKFRKCAKERYCDMRLFDNL